MRRRLGVWLWRYRAGLAPLWAALILAAIGWLAAGRTPPEAPALAALLAAATVWFGGEQMSPRVQTAWMWLVPDTADTGRKGVLDRPTERGYLALLLLGSGAWLAVRIRYGWVEPVQWVLLGLTGGLGAPWWWHRGWRRKRPMNTYARRWKRVRQNDDLKVWHGSKVVEVAGAKAVTTLRVRLRSGLTVKHVARDSLVLDSALNLRGGATTVTAHPSAARDVVVRIVPRDPWTKPIPHPLPPLGSLSLTRAPKVMIGQYEDATPDLIPLDRHLLVVGSSGSGKSEWLQSLVAYLLACEHTAIVAADLASGATFDVWEPVLAAPLATDVPSAFEFLGGLFRFIEHRERKLSKRRRAGEPINVLPISAAEPAVWAIFDEFPDLVNGARVTLGPDGQPLDVMTVLERIARKARKVNVRLVLAAQNPGVADVGSTVLRAQFPITVGLALDEQQSKTLWGSLRASGWTSESLTVGRYLCRDRLGPDHQTPRVGAGVFLDPPSRADLIERASRRPTLFLGEEAHLIGGRLGTGQSPAIGATARHGVYEEAPPAPLHLAGRPALVLVRDNGAAPAARPASTPAASQVAPPRLVSRTRAERLADLDVRITAELPGESQGGVRPGELAERLGVSRHVVGRALDRLQSRGRAMPNGDGTWSRVDG